MRRILYSSHQRSLVRRNLRLARSRWKEQLGATLERALTALSVELQVSIERGDLLLLEDKWYVTHTGLLHLAQRKRCAGIHVRPDPDLCDPSSRRWAFAATVFRSGTCKGFIGYGDADPSNVSPQVQGAEMRVAETRAVNRALRKAYGIGICSVEEIGSLAMQPESAPEPRKSPQTTNGNSNSHLGGRSVRDRLCQLIRQHQLDASLVKSYATDFCGVKTLRDATRQQVENFVGHLADWADTDRAALCCQLNSYLPRKEGAA